MGAGRNLVAMMQQWIAKERWRRLAGHPRNATFEEVEALLLASGWRLERMRGSHAYYVRDGRRLSVPFRRGSILPVYAKLVLEVTRERGDDEF